MHLIAFHMYRQRHRNIPGLLAIYRANFPKASIIPKMHLHEDRVVPCIRRWGLDTGLRGSAYMVGLSK